MVLILSDRDVRALLDMTEAIEAVEQAYVEFYNGQAVVPTRIMMSVPRHQGRLAVMPAYLAETDVLATKIVTGYENNRKLKLPYILALIIVSDSRTGSPLAIMDGEYITALKTAAASGVATAQLASPDAKVLGIVGAGVQARSHLWALKEVTGIENVLVCSSSEESSHRFKEEMEDRFNVGIQPQNSPRAVVDGSDILVTATNCNNPVVSASWLRRGMHVNIIDCHNSLDTAAIEGATVVVESREAFLHAMVEEQRITLKEPIYGEIGEIITGAKKGRRDSSEITVYKSVGIAVQDAAIAARVYRKALESGVGINVAV